MVGWWLAGLLTFSHSEWLLRLPAVVLPLVLAWCGWWMVRPSGAERARFAAGIILLQPANVWNVLITTDTPVILFSMLSVLAYTAALRSTSTRGILLGHVLAGGMLSLAFLGKYFAALLGIAYLAHLLFVRRDCHRFTAFAWLFVAALPGPIYNLWWNSHHGWVNILFNFVNRNGHPSFSLSNPSLYLLSLLYLATPWLMFEFWRQRSHVNKAVGQNTEASVAFWTMLLPISLFALMSLWRNR